MNLFAELKRRNVFRVALFYVVTAWLIIEVAETVLPLFDVPDGVLRGLVVLLVIGLVPALACRGSTSSPRGHQARCRAVSRRAAVVDTGRKLNWATLAVAVLAIGFHCGSTE
jgi:adenylate cyclase